jgi:hypothetical protein
MKVIGKGNCAEDGFYKRARSAYLERIHSEGFTLDLDVVKTSLLLALDECTRFPRFTGLEKCR